MLKLNVNRRRAASGIFVIDLEGTVDRDTAHMVDREISGLVQQGCAKIVINCLGLSYLSSAGIGVFMSHLIRLHKSGGDIKFYGLSRHVSTVLEAGGFTKVLDVCETEAEAVGRFRSADSQREAKEAAVLDAHSLRIDQRRLGEGVVVLGLTGDIDRHTIDSLERSLAGAIESGRASIVVNCGGVTFLSSNGMGIFIQYVQKARSHGGDIRFCEMRDNALTVITMLGLQHIFQVFQTEEEALASYGT
ncbi:STAS domain-containing protein [Planctomycetota bacterium]